MSTQKALYLLEAKGRLAVGDAPIYNPGAGELLVKLYATALNPVDWKFIEQDVFVQFLSSYPAVVGSDGAGEVVEIGEGVTGFEKGDKVFFQGGYEPKYGTFQQYTLADAGATAKIPEGISYDQASTFPVALTAAYLGLYKGLGLAPLTAAGRGIGAYANTPLVIIGGSSNVGQFALQLAQASGFSPIITTASLKHTEFLKSLGATHIIDRKIPLSSLPSEVAKITDKSILHVLDAISLSDTQQASYDLLSHGGKLTIVLHKTLTQKEGDGKEVVHIVGVRNHPGHRELLVDGYKHWPEWVKTGLLRPSQVEVVSNGLAGIPDGLKRLQNDQVSGVKLVAHPFDPIA
ncbi:GroES-like protein [Pluteus cervinus]|uniref:GroES-like protein n=1 Tax=Pluteus cervinus TaxID=181527 RepID=A0ACD3B1H8_9AGAR|nr:GroES-like protein [Pluteus cervinus]